jgi:hypothetical protein
LIGAPKMKSALALAPPTTMATTATITMRSLSFTRIDFQNMTATSNLAWVRGLRYVGRTLDPGAQTIRPGRAKPVSCMLGGTTLTGYLSVVIQGSSVVRRAGLTRRSRRAYSFFSGITSLP